MASRVFLIGLTLSLLSLVYGRGFTSIDKRDPEYKRMVYRFKQQKRGVCVDVRKSEHCEDMIHRYPNYCKDHEAVMKVYCSKSCKFCKNECKDEYNPEFCKVASECGNFCERNYKQLPEKYCKKTCKLCGGSVKPPSPVQAECGDKIGSVLCNSAIKTHGGEKNKANTCSLTYMIDYCWKSCGLCDEERKILSDDVSQLLDLLEAAQTW